MSRITNHSGVWTPDTKHSSHERCSPSALSVPTGRSERKEIDDACDRDLAVRLSSLPRCGRRRNCATRQSSTVMRVL